MKKNTITGTIWQAAVALFLILPLVVTATYSFSERWITILPENLTLKFYQARLSDGRFWAGILRGMAAAAILGADEFYGFVRIIVPAILPGLVNTALINFAGLFGDFAIIKIIAASQFETVQTYLYKSRNTDT